MGHFAKVENGLVTDVIVAEQDFIDSGVVGDPAIWFKTSYNTYGNVHYAPSPPAEPGTPDGGTPIRANYAGIGYTYDPNYTIGDYVGVFYAPQPYPSWVLNTDTFLWEAPTPPGPMPTTGGPWVWDEATLSWVEAPIGA
jgi:hypothetical protein